MKVGDLFCSVSSVGTPPQPLRNTEPNVNTVKEGNNYMLEIKGKVNTAICYAKVIEDEAINQIRRMCDYDITAGSKIRIMPDVDAAIQIQISA